MTASHPTALRESFDRDGFVALPGFVTGESFATLQRELTRFLKDVVPTMPTTQVYYDDPADPASLKQLQQLGAHDAFFHDLGTRSQFSALAETLLGEPATLQNIQFFDKPPGSSKPTPPHQDGAYFPIQPNHAVTMWLALEDVGEEQGCVRYVRGSHRRGLRDHTASGTLGFSRGIVDYPDATDRTHELAFPCTAGTLLAHHSMMIHRADHNRSADLTRKALGFIYYAASCVIDEDAHRAYQANLAEKLAAQGRLPREG